MLKVLFGRYSFFVRALEAAGVLLASIWLYQHISSGLWNIPDMLIVSLLSFYGFIRFCALYRWYSGVKSKNLKEPQLGIEIHFLKALVPTSYILPVAFVLYWLGLEWVSAVLSNVMIIAIASINIILISFHVSDDDPLPVNFFTRELIISKAVDPRVVEGHNKHSIEVAAKPAGESSAI